MKKSILLFSALLFLGIASQAQPYIGQPPNCANVNNAMWAHPAGGPINCGNPQPLQCNANIICQNGGDFGSFENLNPGAGVAQSRRFFSGFSIARGQGQTTIYPYSTTLHAPYFNQYDNSPDIIQPSTNGESSLNGSGIVDQSLNACGIPAISGNPPNYPPPSANGTNNTRYIHLIANNQTETWQGQNFTVRKRESIAIPLHDVVQAGTQVRISCDVRLNALNNAANEVNEFAFPIRLSATDFCLSSDFRHTNQIMPFNTNNFTANSPNLTNTNVLQGHNWALSPVITNTGNWVTIDFVHTFNQDSDVLILRIEYVQANAPANSTFTCAGVFVDNVEAIVESAPASIAVLPCAGGLEASLPGGVGPFTYIWSNNHTGSQLTNGIAGSTYSVIITDLNSNCTGTASAVYPTVTAPNPNWTSTPATCDGACNGAISLASISGGFPGFLYALNGGTLSQTSSWTGLCPGSTSDCYRR